MAKKRFDWDSMEADWRAGVKSMDQLSKEYGVAKSSIHEHWKKAGIERDLKEKINDAVEAELNRRVAIVKRKEELAEQSNQTSRTTSRTIKDKEIVKAVAIHKADIVSSQEQRIIKFAGITDKLIDELNGQIQSIEDLDNLGEMLRNENDSGMDKLNDTYRRVISFPGRVDSLKKLSDTMKTYIELQRKVHKLDTEDDGKAKESVTLNIGKM